MSEEISVVQHGDSIDISEADRELIPNEGYIVDHITGEKLVKDTPKEQEVVREMRHKGTSIMVASQDPPSVPVALIELSSQIILHRCNSPAWLKHIQKANSTLNNLTPEKMSHLGAGEAYIWSARATDQGFTRGAIKVKLRPRITQHGGDTRTAVVQ